MRILSFSKKWDKLQQPEFTTFRYPRVDKDWYVDELVQVYYKSRSPQREKLGIAEIVNKDIYNLIAGVTDDEARTDGFNNKDDMLDWMLKTYGCIPSFMNKLTLRWIDEANFII